jgi:hypothetical protein
MLTCCVQNTDSGGLLGSILVVENHPDTLKYLILFLEALGYHPWQAQLTRAAAC